MKHALVGMAALTALAACSAPGSELVPEPGDFAFLEVTLKG